MIKTVYRREHELSNCKEWECKPLFAYVRMEGKWVRIGTYGSECNIFEPHDPVAEQEDRLRKQRITAILARAKQPYNKKQVTYTYYDPVGIPNLFDIDIKAFCSLDKDDTS